MVLDEIERQKREKNEEEKKNHSRCGLGSANFLPMPPTPEKESVETLILHRVRCNFGPSI